MILGVYWYYKFPENLYRFTFFTFSKGMGGHANNSAELEARVSIDNPENFLKDLEILVSQFQDLYVHIKIKENQLLISTGDYTLFDYHFQFVSEIEELLNRENAVSLDHTTPFKATGSTQFCSEDRKLKTIEHQFIQLTGSDFKKNNAENSLVRIDCNLPLIHKRAYIDDLVKICNEENINVLYYNDFDFKKHCNLMLFFTNGRQKKDAIQWVDLNSFGNKINHLTQKYPLHFGHLESMRYYPLNGPHRELMTDEEYIINLSISLDKKSCR